MFSLFGLLLCLLWCAVDIVAVNRGFGLNTKQSIIAGMGLFAVQMIGVLCGGVAVALIAEPIVRHFFGNSEATIGISLLTGYASVPVSTYLVGLWWLKQYQLPRMEKPDRLFVKTVAAALPLVQLFCLLFRCLTVDKRYTGSEKGRLKTLNLGFQTTFCPDGAVFICWRSDKG